MMPEIDFDYIVARCGGSMCLDDLTLLYQTADDISPKVILEIGACDGCSSMVLGFLARKYAGHLYSVEVRPRNAWQCHIDDLGLSEYVTLIHASSPWVPVDEINTPIDYLLIDGEHRTRWCLVDYHYWNHYVRRGGYIAFHDYHGNIHAPKVKRAINLILETDTLVEVGHTESDQGLIVFQKP